jgi:signal transduction histidine kinase/ActR/RegA family two-component response regulator
VTATARAVTLTTRIKARSGSARIPPGDGGGAGYDRLVRNPRRDSDELLHDRRGAERIVSAISRRLVPASTERIDAVVIDGLAEAARWLGADAAALVRRSQPGGVEYTHSWFEPELGPLPFATDRRAHEYDWLADRLVARGALVIDVRDMMQRLGVDTVPPLIEQLGVVPMHSGDELIGALCLFFRRRCRFEQSDLEPFELLGDLMMSALVRRDAEATQRRLEAELAGVRQLEALGQLAGGVAHDFNNLLTVILAHASRGKRQTAGDLHGDFVEIERASRRAAEMTRQLLAFARREQLVPRPLSLGALVSGLTGVLRQVVGEHIELRLDIADDLSPVLADPTQLERVLVNLAANARDAMPDGGALELSAGNAPPGEALPGELPAGEYVVISVVDSGHGMSPEVQARIFQPFFTTKETGKGTGLGLASAYGAVRQMGGSIAVDSAPGRGTRFTIHLPRADVVPAVAARPPAEVDAAKSRRGTILYVEDEPQLQAIASRLLGEAGYRVLVARDGDEALEVAARQDRIDLLITDVVLPRRNGYLVAAALRDGADGLRVLYTSGYPRQALPSSALGEPGTAYLAKPFSYDGLLAAVDELFAPER